jgi:hypothetical protein
MNTTTKKTKAPKKTSDRKRPNKSYILKLAEYRGFMSGNDKTSLITLGVKNVMQRVNNVAMSDDATVQFTGAENTELQRLMKEFVKNVDEVLKRK